MKKLPVMVMTAALMLTTAGCGYTIKGHEDISEITEKLRGCIHAAPFKMRYIVRFLVCFINKTGINPS